MSTILRDQLIHKAKEDTDVDEEIVIPGRKELSKKRSFFLEDLILRVISKPSSVPLPCGRNRSGSEVKESEGISLKHQAIHPEKANGMGSAGN